MKRLLALFSVFMLILAACSTITTVQKVEYLKPTSTDNTAVQEVKEVQKAQVGPSFVVRKQTGVRYTDPPKIVGTVLNNGTGVGNAKITGKIYYGGVIAYENSVIVENIQPEKEVPFEIPVNKSVQWTSYTAIAEVAS